MKKIAIFASGTGSNAKKIIEYFATPPSLLRGEGPGARVSLIVSNKPDAGVLKIAGQHHIPTLIIDKEKFFRGNGYADELKEREIDFIVLAGFLWKMPVKLIAAYPDKIINIHPALLPKYGGKGMYGHHVHEAVLAAGEKESGIPIHYVDELYDHGKTILQVKCIVDRSDSPESLAKKVQQLEHEYYPKVIDDIVSASKNKVHKNQ
jgi:phosphoribosylglycinamide formyltransferase-1